PDAAGAAPRTCPYGKPARGARSGGQVSTTAGERNGYGYGHRRVLDGVRNRTGRVGTVGVRDADHGAHHGERTDHRSEHQPAACPGERTHPGAPSVVSDYDLMADSFQKTPGL